MSDTKQTLELTTKPAANLAKVMTAKMPEFLAVAAPNVKADPNWMARAQLEIMIKTETASLMLKPRGLETACYAIMRAATVGINFGGTKPQAYFVPSGDGVRLDVSQYGYLHAAVYGPGAVLSQVPELVKVYQNDGTRMDQSTGEIIFPAGGIDPFKDRGELMGYMMRLEFKDGRQPQVQAIALRKVKEIIDRYGQTNSPAHKKSPEEMWEKTAVKQLLKRAFGESEGRAQDFMDFDESPIIHDQGDRLNRRMDQAMDTIKPAETMADDDYTVEVEEEKTEPVQEKKSDPDNLF